MVSFKQHAHSVSVACRYEQHQIRIVLIEKILGHTAGDALRQNRLAPEWLHLIERASNTEYEIRQPKLTLLGFVATVSPRPALHPKGSQSRLRRENQTASAVYGLAPDWGEIDLTGRVL